MPDEPAPPRAPAAGRRGSVSVAAERRRACSTLSALRGLRPLACYARGVARRARLRGCVESRPAGRLGSAGDREWLPKIDAGVIAARVDGRRRAARARGRSRVRRPAARPLGSAGVPLPAREAARADVHRRSRSSGSRKCSELGREIAHGPRPRARRRRARAS